RVMRQARWWLGGVTILAVGWLVVQTQHTRAGDDEKVIRDKVMKIADAVKTGDGSVAKQIATDVGKKIEEYNEVMYLFKPAEGKSKIKGLGIEQKLMDLSGKTPVPAAVLAKEAAEIEKMAHVTAAIGEIALARGWTEKEEPRKKKTK